MSLTALIFLVLYGGALGLAMFRHPVYGLYAYMAEFYMHPVDHWWGGDLPDLRWSLIAAAITILATLRLPAQPTRQSWLASGGARMLLALTLWFWIQNTWASLPQQHLEASILFSKYLVLIYLMHRLLDSEELVRRFFVAHVAGCLYLGLLVLQAPPGGRLEGVGGADINEANALGMQLSTGLLFAASLIIRGPLVVRLFALSAVPLIANGIVQTQSRGTFLGLLAGGAVMLVLMPGQFRKYWYVLGIVGLGILIRVAPENYWDRIGTIGSSVDAPEEVDGSTEGRMALFAAQWRMFQDYPMGTGHRGTGYLSPRYLDQKYLTRAVGGGDDTLARTSHNTFMSALVEQGVPGAVIFASLVLWIMKTSLKLRSLEAERPDESQGLSVAAVGGTLASILVAGMFTDYLKAEVFVWCIALLGILAELAQQRQNAPAENRVPDESASLTVT